MNAEEREIYYYLKARRREFVPARELSRRIGGKRRFHAFPDWAKSVLLGMVERGILEADDKDQFRLKPRPEILTHGKRWTSPALAKLLKEKGKAVGSLLTADEEDEYYDQL
jgi:hypothetical protein